MNDRRAVLHGAVAATAWCCAGRTWAQPARTLYRIGVLGVGPDPVDMAGPQPRNTSMAALISGLRDLGYAYGERPRTRASGRTVGLGRALDLAGGGRGGASARLAAHVLRGP